MKTKTWIVIFSVLLALCLGLSALLLTPGQGAAYAEVVSGATVVRTVPLSINTSFTVTGPNGGTNTVTVKDGAIAVTEASCPDHYCMLRGYCSGGTQIVCLPNSLIIRFLEDSGVDGVVG